ncbi:hypothetical protein B0H11DRAFT_1939783 [Mycena galericulata]|nr:hypothetical protein B0H11DRAFT_1939783 [Mycena galericulata]
MSATTSRTSSSSCDSVSGASPISSVANPSSATKEAISVSLSKDAPVPARRASVALAFPYSYTDGEQSRAESETSTPRYTRRPVVLTEEQVLNPPTLPPLTPVKACRKALLRAATRVNLISRKASLPLPAPIDPKSLSVADVPATVYTSKIALPPRRGPAPAISAPPRKRYSLDPALCPGW